MASASAARKLRDAEAEIVELSVRLRNAEEQAATLRRELQAARSLATKSVAELKDEFVLVLRQVADGGDVQQTIRHWEQWMPPSSHAARAVARQVFSAESVTSPTNATRRGTMQSVMSDDSETNTGPLSRRGQDAFGSFGELVSSPDSVSQKELLTRTVPLPRGRQALAPTMRIRRLSPVSPQTTPDSPLSPPEPLPATTVQRSPRRPDSLTLPLTRVRGASVSPAPVTSPAADSLLSPESSRLRSRSTTASPVNSNSLNHSGDGGALVPSPRRSAAPSPTQAKIAQWQQDMDEIEKQLQRMSARGGRSPRPSTSVLLSSGAEDIQIDVTRDVQTAAVAVRRSAEHRGGVSLR